MTSHRATSRRAFTDKTNAVLHFEEQAREVLARCRTLAVFSEDTSSIHRTFLSSPMRDCHRELSRWLKPLGCTTHIDAAGNFRAVYPGLVSDAPRVLIGSHLDTVPNGGAYDGVLGIILAIELLTSLNERKLPFAIELLAFSDEEGVRFGVPFIGSRALVGSLSEDLLTRKDTLGVTLGDAIMNFGLNPAEIPQCAIHQNAMAYLEFHIEQGPVLDTMDRPLAAVEAVAGQSRLTLTFSGRSNHAGTTPMNLRHDALAGAAEWISSVERFAKSTSDLVATVGSMQVHPGAGNVIASEARVSLDVRHRDDMVRKSAVAHLLREAEGLARRRALNVTWSTLMDQPAVAMDPFLVETVEHAIRSAGCESHRMVSGAGHDAMIMAQRLPSAMIFLRSPGGVSHNPAESVKLEDVDKAIGCGLHLLNQLASSADFLSRNSCE